MIRRMILFVLETGLEDEDVVGRVAFSRSESKLSRKATIVSNDFNSTGKTSHQSEGGKK